MSIRTISLVALLTLASTSAHSEEFEVSLVNHAFQPADITIQVGDSVRWTNTGGMPHNVRADDDSFRCAESCGAGGEGGPYGSNDGDPSSAPWTYVRQFTQPGVISYYCEVHGAPGGLGMAGTITVLEGAGPPEVRINYGHTGAWFNASMSGQGFLIEIIPLPEEPQVFIAWFTFATEAGDSTAQRWFTAQGSFEHPSDRVELTVFRTTGGAFAQSNPPAATEPVGTALLVFHSCIDGTFSFEIDIDGETVSAELPIQRIAPDVICEDLQGG